MLGAQVRRGAPSRPPIGIARVDGTPRSAESARKSSIVHRWMLGVSNHGSGSSRVTGIRPPHSSDSRTRQWREIGKGHERAPARSAAARPAPCRARAWSGACRRGSQVEAGVGIVGEVDIGVALDHRQPARDGGGDVGRIELHAARVDPRVVAQRRHQRTVAAADIEHPRARRHMAAMIARSGRSVMRLPATREEAVDDAVHLGRVEQEGVMAVRLDSSTKLTGAPAALSAWTMLRDSAVGYSQSVSKLTRQKRVARAAERIGELPAMLLCEIEIIHRAGDVEIGIGVEPVDEAQPLVAQIAFDLEVGVEAEGLRRRAPAAGGRTSRSAPLPTDR